MGLGILKPEQHLQPVRKVPEDIHFYHRRQVKNIDPREGEVAKLGELYNMSLEASQGLYLKKRELGQPKTLLEDMRIWVITHRTEYKIEKDAIDTCVVVNAYSQVSN